MSLMDTALRYCYSTASDAKAAAMQIRDEVRTRGGVLVLNWHAHLLNPDISQDSWDLYIDIIRDAKKDGAWVARPADVIEWWERRSCAKK